eukprot:6196757-Pleurochrysis_carterae.AAC.3
MAFDVSGCRLLTGASGAPRRCPASSRARRRQRASVELPGWRAAADDLICRRTSGRDHVPLARSPGLRRCSGLAGAGMKAGAAAIM